MPALNPLTRLSSGICIALIGAAVCGCASSKEEGLPAAARTAGSRPPLFLTGAASVLLTNAGESYSAWIEMDPSSSGSSRDFTSGQLLCRGSKLLFIPTHGSKKKRAKAGGVTFIWDVAEKQGTVLSEALQGFAPFTAYTNPTNVVISAGKSSQQKIEGHSCKSEESVVQMNDGSATLFQVWRAMDLKAIPVQVNTATNVPPSTIVLSKLRLESLSEGLFAPPEGFTKYSSPEAMMDELAVRQGNFKRKPSEEFTPPSPEESPYRRGR